MAMAEHERLPGRRRHEILEFEHVALPCRACVGRYAEERVGEIFLNIAKDGSAADVNARDSAIVCSIALQYGADPETIRRALCRDSQGRASGPLGMALDVLADGAR
jgi:hypothetical protein